MTGKYTLSLYILVAACLLSSCTKDRIFPDGPDSPFPVDPSGLIAPGSVRINEFVARGSQLTSNLGVQSDWIELYNTLDVPVELKAGQWFLTDKFSDSSKVALYPVTLAPHEYYIIFCDDVTLYNGQMHAGFGLSSDGEEIALYYRPTGKKYTVMDTVTYGPQTASNKSVARIPDGSAHWKYPSDPTPGNPNQ